MKIKNLLEGLNAQQRSVPQLPAMAKAKHISVLGAKEDPKHPFAGYMVGADESIEEHFDGEYDDEAGMAHGNLHTIARAAQGLLDTIDDNENLPEWAQEKIAKVEGMLVAVWNYLQSQEEQGIDPEIAESAAWRRKEGKSKSGGLNAKGVASYRRENPGSKLQTAVTTKPSKLKPGSKAAKRRKSFCARMSGVKGPMKKPNGKPTRKALALRKWNCESIEQSVAMLESVGQNLKELKQRLDPKCWKGKHKEGTKIKGGVRVNNCVPNESVEQGVAEGSEKQYVIYFVIPEYEDYLHRNESEERTIVIANSANEAAKKFKAETPDAHIKEIVPMNQGVAEGFPYDVDHMHGSIIRNADMTTDNVKTNDKAYWDRAVDSINAKVFDDMAEFRTDSRGESVTGNSAVWAKWDNATETGWFNHKGRPLKPWPVKESGVAEEWSKKYKDSINCSNPKGFSQKAHCAGKNKNEGVAEMATPDSIKAKNKAAAQQVKVKESVANEDVLGALKDKLGDYLKSLGDEVKSDKDLQDKLTPPADTIAPAVRTITTDDGREIKIHGNEDDGFHISIKGKEGTTKFESLDHAEMATKMYCAHRRNNKLNSDYMDEA